MSMINYLVAESLPQRGVRNVDDERTKLFEKKKIVWVIRYVPQSKSPAQQEG